MERISPIVVELCCLMVTSYYGAKYATNSIDLAALVQEEFDVICFPEDVEEFVIKELPILEALEMSELIGIA